VFYLSFPHFIVLFILFSISLSYSLLYSTPVWHFCSSVFLCRVIGIGNAKLSSRNVLQVLIKLLYFGFCFNFSKEKLTFKHKWLDLLKLKKRVERRKFQVWF
jgi:hypothetical protein